MDRPLSSDLAAARNGVIVRIGRVAVVFLLILGVVNQVRPVVPPVPLGVPQTVDTTIPRLAMHTRLTDEVEPWKIKRTLEMVRAMGAPTIIEFFPWAYYEKKQGVFDWRHPDLVIDHAHTQGLTVIARVGMVPDWARPDGTPLNYLEPDSYGAFADYAAAFAARYQDRVCCLIVGNEPNLAFEWGGRATTAADYVDLLKVVYPAIKTAAPDMRVLAGALAPTIEPPGSAVATNDLVYLQAMYDAGAIAYFDALAVHGYGLTFAPDDPPDPNTINFRRLELLRAIMEAAGDTRPVYMTEGGYGEHPTWVHAVSPAERTQYTVAALDYALTEWEWLTTIGWWMFRTPAPPDDYNAGFVWVNTDFEPSDLYRALAVKTGNRP